MTDNIKRNTPTTGLINSIRMTSSFRTTREAIYEFIDNSLGEAAGKADNVYIISDKNHIQIIDDGKGISNINSMFKIGESISSKNAKDIGQYGIGGKYAGLFLGDKITVETMYKGKYHHATVDWSEVEKEGEWPVEYDGEGVTYSKAPQSFKNKLKTISPRNKIGTIITIEKLCKDKSKKWNPSNSAGHMAFWYRPALMEYDKTIKLKFRQGKKVKMINLFAEISDLNLEEKSIRFEDTVRKKSLEGIMCINENLKSYQRGLFVAYGMRIVCRMKRSEIFIPKNICGIVNLGYSWKRSLNSNKNDIITDRIPLVNKIKIHASRFIKEQKTEEETIAYMTDQIDIENILTQGFSKSVKETKIPKDTAKIIELKEKREENKNRLKNRRKNKPRKSEKNTIQKDNEDSIQIVQINWKTDNLGDQEIADPHLGYNDNGKAYIKIRLNKNIETIKQAEIVPMKKQVLVSICNYEVVNLLMANDGENLHLWPNIQKEREYNPEAGDEYYRQKMLSVLFKNAIAEKEE